MNAAAKLANSNAADGVPVGPGTQPAVSAELLRVDDVCALLQINRRTLHRHTNSGRIPRPVKLGHLVRWRRAELMQWLERGCPPVRTVKH
jgi:prophage regulatory protein